MRHTTKTTLALLAMLAVPTLWLRSGDAAETLTQEQRNAQAATEIRAQSERMLKEARAGNTAIFTQMISPDYAEFDPFFPFLLDPPKSMHTEIQKAWDAYDKLPRTDRAHKIEKIQVYGDVALQTFTSVAKGAQVRGGFMTQAKFLSVYVKKNGIWVLVYTHDGRRVGPTGQPID